MHELMAGRCGGRPASTQAPHVASQSLYFMLMCVAPIHPLLTSNPHLEQERVKDLHKRLQAEHLLR